MVLTPVFATACNFTGLYCMIFKKFSIYMHELVIFDINSEYDMHDCTVIDTLSLIICACMHGLLIPNPKEGGHAA